MFHLVYRRRFWASTRREYSRLHVSIRIWTWSIVRRSWYVSWISSAIESLGKTRTSVNHYHLCCLPWWLDLRLEHHLSLLRTWWKWTGRRGQIIRLLRLREIKLLLLIVRHNSWCLDRQILLRIKRRSSRGCLVKLLKIFRSGYTDLFRFIPLGLRLFHEI